MELLFKRQMTLVAQNFAVCSIVFLSFCVTLIGVWILPITTGGSGGGWGGGGAGRHLPPA